MTQKGLKFSYGDMLTHELVDFSGCLSILKWGFHTAITDFRCENDAIKVFSASSSEDGCNTLMLLFKKIEL